MRCLDKIKLMYGNSLHKVSDNIYSFEDNGKHFVLINDRIFNTGRIRVDYISNKNMYGIEKCGDHIEGYVMNMDASKKIRITNKSVASIGDIMVLARGGTVKVLNTKLDLLKTIQIKDMTIVDVRVFDSSDGIYEVEVKGYNKRNKRIEGAVMVEIIKLSEEELMV